MGPHSYHALVALLTALCVRGDLPVHCLHHEVLGDWRLTLGPMREHRSSCGHMRPDSERHQPPKSVVDKQGALAELLVTIKHPNVATTPTGQTGTWTMVYDEGFLVTVDRLDFFAFSNFTFEKNSNARLPVTERNVSHCTSTMVGWYQDEDRTKFGCYYGNKDPSGQSLVQTQTQGAAKAYSAWTWNTHLTQAALRVDLAANAPLDARKQASIVRQLNAKLSAQESGWHAKAMPRWNGRTMRGINSFAGLRRAGHHTRRHDRFSAAAPSPSGSFLQRRGRKSSGVAPGPKSANGLPAKFDWSNVNGRDFLEPVMDQADCGSCYVTSSVRMLTARHRIRQNDTKAAPWSINFPLFCSEYNQGCNGGYGILTARWARDVGLLPEECMPYNTSGQCNLECDLSSLKGKRFRATGHRYVGSWYGNSSVEAIKAELFHNGPLVLGLEPGEDFMFYSDGIYRNSVPVLLQVGDHEWERVDHSVLLVGWGEEDGTPYWRIQNSWSRDWGEAGFFRIVMGENESGIETIPEAADVVEDEQQGKQVSAFFEQLSTGAAQRSPPGEKPFLSTAPAEQE